MKEGFTFKKVSLKFLRKVIFKNFGGGGGTEKSQNFYYLPRRFENEAQPLLVASKTCQLAEVLGLILYRAHRLELHSSRRTAELNLSSSLPSSLLFLHFPSLILILPLLSLDSYFPLSLLLIFPSFRCRLS